MEIKYLTLLRDNQIIRSVNSDISFNLEPLDEAEVMNLEASYNNLLPFPLALRELLSLAGKYCYVLEYGPSFSLKTLQESVRASLVEYGKTITTPLFAIDVYSGNEQFLFVFLNEGDDPVVRQVNLEEEGPTWIRSTNRKLSDYINMLTLRRLSGINPF
jgi:hypothetical protein